MAELLVAPAVLRWARESYGLDLDVAADHLDISRSQLEEWELGRSAPSLVDLKRLALGYRRQLAALLLPTPPLDDEPRLPDFRSRSDYTPPHLSPGLHIAIRQARLRQLALTEIAEDIAWARFPLGSADSDTDPESIASSWRAHLGVSVATQTSWKDLYAALRAWRDLAEASGVLVVQFAFGDEDVRGFALADPPVPTVALNTSDAPAGRIFTLFHELGHLLVGNAGICAPAGAMQHPDTSLAVERFCNRFAGAFLVPLNVLSSLDEAKRLAQSDHLPSESDFADLRRIFKVSSQVLWYRLNDAGLLDDERYKSGWRLWAEPMVRPSGSGGSALDRAERSLATNGRRFVNAMIEAEERGLISFADVLDYLHVKEGELRKLAALAADIH